MPVWFAKACESTRKRRSKPEKVPAQPPKRRIPAPQSETNPLQSKTGRSKNRFFAPKNGLQKTPPYPEVPLRFEPGKQVWLSIEPTNSARHKIIVEANPGLRFQLNVLRTESGDVMLKEVPVVDLMRMAFGGVSRWLTKYYDWNIQESAIDALSAKTENTYSRDLLKQFGEITGHTARTLAGFDLQEVKKQIDQGHPVVIERVLAPERTNQLMTHARARVENPAYELPSADDSEEQNKWGKQGLGLRVWLCVIVGYRAPLDRGCFFEVRFWERKKRLFDLPVLLCSGLVSLCGAGIRLFGGCAGAFSDFQHPLRVL
ncbi:MAG: hypothetical protein IPK32_04900 [Verrucomicrobiaceae bacterium]|nr:hypothetical protein [Verrucomicrobiaceae bacterium]